MNAPADTAPHASIGLESRLRATARSERNLIHSLRSGPLALATTALTVVVGAWLLGAGNRGSYLAAREPAR